MRLASSMDLIREAAAAGFVAAADARIVVLASKKRFRMQTFTASNQR
jgi:hypothetical protein